MPLSTPPNLPPHPSARPEPAHRQPHESDPRTTQSRSVDGRVDSDQARLLIISAAFPPMVAGEAGHALHLATRLSRPGNDVHLLTTNRPGTRTDYPFTVHPVMQHWGWREQRRLADVIRDLNPRAILLIYAGWNYGHHPMITHAASLAKRIVPQARFVTQIEYPSGAVTSRLGWSSRIASKVIRATRHRQSDYQFGTLLSHSDAIIALSEHHLETLTQRNPDVTTKAHVFPPAPLMKIRPSDGGTARRDGRSRLNLRDHETLLVYIGLVTPGKGIETLLDAFALAAERNPSLRLAIVGGVVSEGLSKRAEYLEQVNRRCTDLKLDAKVMWTGAFDPDADEASTYLRAADVAILPWDQGVCMNNSSVANVAAHDLPIITTRPQRLEPPFIDGQNLLLCPPRDPGALAAAIDRVVSDPAVRSRLSHGACDLARQWYDWSAVTRRTLDALDIAAADDAAS